MSEKLRILVVDDNEEFCQNVTDILELKDYEVVTASDGFKALELVKQNGFALVLMDAHQKYVGQVGTGMDANDIRGLMSMFVTAPCPWAREPEAATWVKPFPVKVQYLEYTNDGILRFPSLKEVM